jgi:hypothetical protein
MIRQMLQEGVPVESGTVFPRTRTLLTPPGTKLKARRVDMALNEVARAFLSPPAPGHWRAAEKDFASGTALTLPQTSSFLFYTSGYFFDHRAQMPLAANLRTFREYDAAALLALPSANAYYRLWQRVSLNALLVAVSAMLSALLILAFRKGRGLAVVALYSAALVLVAAIMIGMTCLVGEILPRYTLPLWELSWVALIFGAGAIADAGRIPLKQSAGRLGRPG